jgi:cysteine desulfurase
MKQNPTIYLDNAASTPVDSEVIEAMMPYLVGHFGNPSSLHNNGRKTTIAVSKSRAAVSKLIGANPNEIYFTSGGTESNNLALIGYSKMIKKLRPDCNRILVSEIEHDSVLEAIRFIENELKFTVDYIPINSDGIVNIKAFGDLLSPKTSLVSVMLVNNEIGTIQPIGSMVEIIKKRNYSTVFHSDAVQALGKIPIDVKQINVDMLSVSSHKINGPKGIGALYVRKGICLEPIIFGGGQELNLRSGTENVYSIVGFGKACEIWKNRLHLSHSHLQELQGYLIRRVLKEIPETSINGTLQNRIFNNINFSFNGVNGEDLLIKLDEFGIEASTGSACSSNKKKKASHVLKSLGLSYDKISGSIRFSLGTQNTIAEMEDVVNVLKKVVKELRDRD